MPNSDNIRELLCEKHNFNRERTDNALERIKKTSKSTQTTLGDFL